MKTEYRHVPLYLLALALSTLPAAVATLFYFPIWQSRGVYVQISGIALCLILISIIPILRYLKCHLISPSAPLIWLQDAENPRL